MDSFSQVQCMLLSDHPVHIKLDGGHDTEYANFCVLTLGLMSGWTHLVSMTAGDLIALSLLKLTFDSYSPGPQHSTPFTTGTLSFIQIN